MSRILQKSCKTTIIDEASGKLDCTTAMKEGRAVVSGRIDRVILERDRALIIDYKTHSGDHEEIKRIYQPRIEYYKKAVDVIFEPKSIRAYILLTGSGELIKI